MQVDHNYKLHAEIRYETLTCFGMTSAVGNTYKELLMDIKSRLDYYKDRDPEIINVYYDPNGEKIDITHKILKMIRRKK